MKRLKHVLAITLLFILILFVNLEVVGSNNSNSEQSVQYSEQYQKWLELSDEEKQNVIRPRMYDIQYSKTTSKNPLLKANMLRTTLNSSYNLKDVIPNNLIIKDQQKTSSCWAFAALSSLETNLALTNYKNGTNTSKVYDYSERHMEYATSRVFKNNQINSLGYNRIVGKGGNWDFASSYLTNGTGAINESEMIFENNENIIDISMIQNKTITSQVYDTAEFADYNGILVKEAEAKEIKNQIKNHIQNYGSVYGGIDAGGSSFFNSSNISSNGTVRVSGGYGNHAISVIGWDDDYAVSNWDEFDYDYERPTNPGAWIARNSWGKEAGDNGLLYISYEDQVLSRSLSGIIKATDSVEYDNIYQYDYYYPNYEDICNNKIMLCNIFDKKTTGTEYLTQVSLHIPGSYTCRVFVNPNGTNKSKNDLKLVSLKSGESETFNAGYHTLEFEKPIKINSNQFTVAIEISSKDGSCVYGSYVKKDTNLYSSVVIQTGKCFKLDNYEYRSKDDWSGWEDMATEKTPCHSTIKAFTISKLVDESLKNIEITTPPTKTHYLSGENFDKSGMIVKANYNSKTNPSVILDSSNYSITNGTNLKVGQTSVTITYENKTVEQPIQVTENKVENIEITTPPVKTEYWAGEDFDKSGMVVKAKYTNGKTLEITNYTITNSSNLKNNQSSITISYEGKTVEQPIIVKANSVVKIEITQAPNKTNYVVGQNFNNTGMIVKATYSNGTIKVIKNYEVKDGKNLSKGQQTVTITYEQKTVVQKITVVEKAITGISVKTLPTKIKYIQNKEKLDLTGGAIQITYNDGTTEKIEMTSDEVSATGFSNNKLGTIAITLTYQSKTTQFNIEIIGETVIDEKAENSKIENAVVNVKKIKAYYYTNDSNKDYTLIDVEINNISRNLNNDSVEYYYYLSSNANESNIKNWIKINEKQEINDKVIFTIDSRKVSNYKQIANEEKDYLYIKEVVIKGGNQSVAISNPMKLESNVDVDTYLDNVKKQNNDSSNKITNIPDDTVAQGKLPKTGSKAFITVSVIVLVIIIGIVCYKKYIKLRDIT